MTNHVHFLMTPETKDGISKVIQLLGRRYVRHVNGSYRRTETLWEDRFKACIVETERYLLTCHRYIELNPVRAQMVETPHAYRWSSYSANALGVPDPVITPHSEYLRLGRDAQERQKTYRDLFGEHLASAVLRDIRLSANQGLVLGNKRFQDEIEVITARRGRLGRRGRPRSVTPPENIRE